MYAFEFERPTTVDDAVKALASEAAQALGGGQTLVPTLKQRLAAPEALVSLGGRCDDPCDSGRRGRAVSRTGRAGVTYRRPGRAQPWDDWRFTGQ